MNKKIEVKEYKKTFVEYFFPGIIVSESSRQECSRRDKKKWAREIPEGAYRFCFYDVNYMEDAKTGEILKSKQSNKSKSYYVDGVVMDKESVEKNIPDSRILLANMNANGWDLVIKTRRGNVQPFTDDCEVVKL